MVGTAKVILQVENKLKAAKDAIVSDGTIKPKLRVILLNMVDGSQATRDKVKSSARKAKNRSL